MKKLCFLISHKPDIRYIKRFEALKSCFAISVVFWNKDKEKSYFLFDGIDVYEIVVPANKTNPLKRLPQTLNFSKKAGKLLKQINPEIIYAGNLDMLSIACKCKKRDSKIHIVYEVADLHRLIIDKQKNPIKQLISKTLKCKEKRCLKDVELLVLTSMKFFDVYYCNLIGKERVVFMPNMPDESTFSNFLKKKHSDFTVAFVGNIRYKDQLKMLIDAAGIVGVKVIFAGKDDEGNSFKELCSSFDYVTFLGEFDYKKQICDVYSSVDCIYSVYNADMFNVRIALPNKLYEAIYTAIPIIVARNTYLEELVKQLGVGFSVNHNSKTELVELLQFLKNKPKEYLKAIEACLLEQRHQVLSNYNKVLISRLIIL